MMYSTPTIVLSYSMLCICLICGLPVIAARPTVGIRGASGSACEPQSQVIEQLVAKNMDFDNILYPFSVMAETVHSELKKQSGESAVVQADVCRKMEQVANVNLPTLTEAPCPWNYTCTYHPDIYPHYMLQARCLSTDCTYPCMQPGIRTSY